MINQSLLEATEPAVRFNPFPGLRPFQFEESHLFFGRDGQSERLIAKLAAKRFLAVVGTSGSGKSSLVRAGLLPALYSGFMPGAGTAWRIAIMRPGNDPLANLAQALNAPEVFGSDDEANRALQIAITEATLRRGSLGLVEAVRDQQLPATENLLVVADQFEELFRVEQNAQGSEQENDRAAFVKLLLEARQRRDEGPNIYVVLTMRSDYLGDCAQFWDLPEAINESQYLIPRLTREQIREAITGPLFVGGAEATPRLINRLLNDVGDNPDQLPILQHALMRTWDHWRENSFVVPPSGGGGSSAETDRLKAELRTHAPIDLQDYEAIGGMAEALSLHADETLDMVGDERHRLVAERIFKALTEKGPDNREIRRPVELKKLCLISEATEAEVKQVIEAFRAPGRSFLMPPVGTELTAESLIDISHESLMRNWQRLNDWVEDETKSARIYRRLSETAALHLKGEARLWGDPDLQVALDWQLAAQPNPAWAERYDTGYDAAMAFLEKSAAQRTADVAAAERQQREDAERTQRELAAAQALAEAQRQNAEAEKLRAEEQAQAAGKLRRRAWAGGLLALFALLAASLAFASYRSAAAQRTKAEKQQQRAENSEKIANDAKVKAENAAKEAEELKEKAEERQRDAEAAKLAEEMQRKLVSRQNQQLQVSETILAWSLNQSGSLLYVARGLLAQAAMDQNDYIRANEFLEASIPVPGSPTRDDLRSFDWFYRWRQLHDEKATLEGHHSDVMSVSWSPDGRTLASGSFDDTVKLWDVATGQVKATLTGHDGSVGDVSWSPDGRTLASGSSDDTVKLWDVATRQVKATLTGHRSAVLSVSWSPDGRTLASGSFDDTVKLWDVATGQVKATLTGHDSSVHDVSWSPDGRTLASRSGDNTLKLWDVATGQVKATLTGHGRGVSSVSWSPDGRTLASGSEDSTLKLWDVATGQVRATLKGHGDSVHSVSWSPDGRTLASGSRDRTLKLWDVASEQVKAALTGHGRGVSSVSWSPDGRTLASGSFDDTVKLRDVATGQVRATLKGHGNGVSSVSWSPDGRTLASGSGDTTVKLWEVASGHVKATLTGYGGFVLSVSWSPDGRTLASGNQDGTLKLWDVASGQEKATLKGHGDRVTSVSWSPDGRTLASGSWDRTLKLWDVATGQVKATLTGHGSDVYSVSWSPDGRTLASGSRDRTLKLWDVASGQEKAMLISRDFAVLSVSFSPDGRTLASGNQDGTLKLWDVASGQESVTLKGHGGMLQSVSFSPDGRTLASGDVKGELRLWRGATDAEVARQCIRCGRKE